MTDLFDMDLRAKRRDRAARTGVECFLFERVFADCLDRIALIQRRFGRALLIGCPDPGWPARLRHVEKPIDKRAIVRSHVHPVVRKVTFVTGPQPRSYAR